MTKQDVKKNQGSSIINEATANESVWSSEYLQKLIEGENTEILCKHFNQWSLANISKKQRDSLSDRHKYYLGTSYVIYPLRIYRIMQNIGFKVRGNDVLKQNILKRCMQIGKGFESLGIEKVAGSNEDFFKEASKRIKMKKDKFEEKKEIKRLAAGFKQTNMFAKGLEIAGKQKPEIFSQYVLTFSLPVHRLADYPRHFIIFALNRFLEQTKYDSRTFSKYRLLSSFLCEQRITNKMSAEYVKKISLRQRKNKMFIENLKSFYEACQNAYLWPFIPEKDVASDVELRYIIDDIPDLNKPHLSILFPDWEDIF